MKEVCKTSDTTEEVASISKTEEMFLRLTLSGITATMVTIKLGSLTNLELSSINNQLKMERNSKLSLIWQAREPFMFTISTLVQTNTDSRLETACQVKIANGLSLTREPIQ
jgi:hypothetical protein